MKDIFLNITGGIKVEDTAIDLAIVSAILSSNNEIKIPEDYCFAAEIGLSGEIRPVQRIEQRIKEAEKLGFSKIFISKFNDKLTSKKIKVVALSKIDELIGGDPKQNAEKIIQLLDGERGPYRDIVILNSAAALYVDDKVKNIKDGIDLSIHSIDKGLAKSALEKLKKVSNS